MKPYLNDGLGSKRDAVSDRLTGRTGQTSGRPVMGQCLTSGPFLERCFASTPVCGGFGLMLAGLGLALVCLQAADAQAQQATVAGDQQHAEMVQRGVDFLQTRQLQDGSYSPESGLGITALVTTALLRNGVPVDDPRVKRSLDYLRGKVQPDGGIYVADSLHRNYETCLAVMCFVEANDEGQFDRVLENADRFLKDLQWDTGEGIESSDPAYGGAGYGSHKRPDLSNTSFMIEALRALGNEEDSEAIQRALVFVSRCQNLDTKHNDTKFADRVNDGGFYYTVAAGGTSQAGTTANGGLRSYASMTYAGLKSMIYAGLSREDQRVQAALDWIARHYSLQSNPGMGNAGLYYYYHSFAKALAVAGIDQFEDESGTRHDWRQELNVTLAKRQQENGSWVNEKNNRWLEGNPDLVTGYSLLALSYTNPE